MSEGRARLRSLRLVGFKSFAERTALEFGPGISAVVGPNGSGKSNLADALRWALGEQGRQLRTRRSEDVIFAGSARRHATGMADVTLVLENDDRLLPLDFGEVALGRRLYRSGENEYLLNGQRVRLRDLLDLLDGANLADNAFLFIGQGMVDQALSLRPEERRPLFEEAAGVRRHERRRRQAEAQLEEAASNLARVRDILGELRPQARRLAAQAEQQAARREAGERLAAELIAAGRSRWRAAAVQAAAATAALEAARAAADAALLRLTTAEDAAAGLLARLGERALAGRDRRSALDAARAALTELRLAAGRREAEGVALQRERQRLSDERTSGRARLEAARRALVAAEALTGTGPTQGQAADLAIAELEREIARAAAELAQAEASHRATDEEAASARRAEEMRVSELERLGRAASEAERRAAEARAAAERAAAESAAAEAAVATLEVATERARATASAAADALAARQAAVLAADAQRRSRAARVEALAQRRASLEERRAALEIEVEREEMQGLLRAASRRGGRRVAEGLEVDPELRVAVEGALGPALAAAALPRARVAELQGRPGYLVLDERAQPVSERDVERARQGAAAVGGGPLGGAIRRDPQGLVSMLLACTVWVPDLANALAVAAALPPGWQAVTREGEVVRADGLVRLGAPAAPLARRAERDALASELSELAREDQLAQAGLLEATRDLDAATEHEAAAKVALDAARQALRGLEAEGRRAAGAVELQGREQAWAEAQATRLGREAERAQAMLAAARPEPDQAGHGQPGAAATGTPDALATWRARLASLEDRRVALTAERAEREAAAAAVADRRRRAELIIASEEDRLVAGERRERELAEAEAALETAGASAAVDLAAARQTEAEAESALRELDVDELADRDRLATTERAAIEAREEVRRAEEGARTAELAALETRLQLDTVREQLLVELAGLGEPGLGALAPAGTGLVRPGEEDDDAREAALAVQLEAALDAALRAWAEVPAAAVQEPAEIPSPARLAALRRRYREVGASNPFAAEEYAEVKARLEDLEAQQLDLDRAITATRALIAELNERITSQFRSTFAAIEGAFARRFEQLFGGGEAQLVLTDPDDLASTGVEIMARPPGKKRQALAMLSGGERALTAVALLFSMLDVRPVPFCVLDEVDAALDEANITRFTEALRELAGGTQFVVITHNRGTIEAADALYGITIGDDAVSRVISLRLAEATVLVEAAG